LKIVGSRYANDIGEPYLEMFGTRGTLGWGDTALTAPNHLARIAVDRYGPTLSGSVIKFNCEDRNVTSPDGYAEFNIPGGSIELMKTLVPGENNQLIRGTNRGVLLHGFGISSRNRLDTSDQPMYASAFYNTSAMEHKTDLMEVNQEVFDLFDNSTAKAWRYKDDIVEYGEDADWHIGPFSRDFRSEYVQIGPAGREYINVDTKVGVLWARMQRLIRDVKTERDALRSELVRIEGRIGKPTS
jgi:hypothetical protein